MTNNVTVDFTTNVATVNPLGVGISVSGYDGNGHGANITKSVPWLNSVAALAPGHVRVPGRYANGNPGIGAGGAQTTGDLKTYINYIVNTIKSIPYIVYLADTSDNNGTNLDATTGLNATDAAGMVSYFNSGGGQNFGPVKYWIVGNEPDNGNNDPGYVGALSGIISAMKTADPTIKVSAPAAAYWDTGLISSAAGVSGVDILSWHEYDGGNTDGTGFPTDGQYSSHVTTALSYKAGAYVGVEEINWKGSGYDGSGNWYDWHNCNYLADAAGQILTAGGHMTQYSDSNGALGLMNDGSGNNAQPGSQGTTLPAYWGIGIWTGMNGQFKRYGAHMVRASTTFTNRQVTAFACDNNKLVVCNNTTSSQALTIGLTLAGGVTTGTYNVWATNGTTATSPITEVVTGASFIGSTITYTIPAQTTVSIDITPSGAGGGSGGKIVPVPYYGMYPVTATGPVTDAAIAAGTYPGQTIKVLNESAYAITFAAQAVSLVADGFLSAIAPNTAQTFTWSGTYWYRG